MIMSYKYSHRGEHPPQAEALSCWRQPEAARSRPTRPSESGAKGHDLVGTSFAGGTRGDRAGGTRVWAQGCGLGAARALGCRAEGARLICLGFYLPLARLCLFVFWLLCVHAFIGCYL